MYKGEWRGLAVAVKKLKVQDGSIYPDALLDELKREVSIMSTLRLLFFSFYFLLLLVLFLLMIV